MPVRMVVFVGGLAVLVALAVGLMHGQRGTLVATEPEFILRLRCAGGSRLVTGHRGRASLPPGEYRVEGWSAQRQDRLGRRWEVRRAEDEPARVLRVDAGRVTPVSLVSPAKLDLVIEQTGSEVAFHLRLVGAGQETLGEIRMNGRPLPPPSLRIEDARGRIVARLAGENRCGAGCAMVWHPLSRLHQPLRAVPEAGLGPFRLASSAFRFRLAAVASPPVPSVGQAAPDFNLPSAMGGSSIRLSFLRGRPVIIGFFCGCGDCQAASRRLAPAAADMGARMIAVIENERQLQPDRVARFRQVTGFTGPVLADRGGAVTRCYHALACPRVWAIDAGGVIRYRNPDPHTPPGEMVHEIHRALGSSRRR